jgi:hypothetical protein
MEELARLVAIEGERARSAERRLAAQQALLDERLLRVEKNRVFSAWNAVASRILDFRRRYGPRESARRQLQSSHADYAAWIADEQFQLPDPELVALTYTSWRFLPLVSIVMRSGQRQDEIATLRSIAGQLYGHWDVYIESTSGPAATMVTVRATSVADPSRSGVAEIQIRPAITVSLTPGSTALYPAQTQQFTATVANTDNPAVVWSVSPAGVGTLSATGLLTAPATINGTQVLLVKATSVADGAKSATATVTISPAASTVNLARGKNATQSSGGMPASLAVDGNTDGDFSHGSVSHTDQDAYAWWQVDLGASSGIDSVSIWNRTECCGNRLSDYWVFVSDTPFTASDTPAVLQSRSGVWASHQTSPPSPTATIPVNAQGRYVRIQLNATNYLQLAEVQVFGANR